MEKPNSSTHPDEETLELFARGRLNDDDFPVVRKHVEDCEECQIRSMNAGELYNDLCDAFQENPAIERNPTPQFRWFGWPALVTTGAMAVIAVIAIPIIRKPAEPQSIELAALRGNGQAAGVSVAEAGRPLNLKIDLAGISNDSGYFIEIVDSNGKSLIRSAAKVTGNQAQMKYDKTLRAGQYWVRVITETGQPLREMGLEVR